MIAALTAAAGPGAQAGALWWGRGAPIYYPPVFGAWFAPTLVYRPVPILLPRFPGGPTAFYVGRAIGYTHFNPLVIGYTIPWVWGFWDPPEGTTAETEIQYAQVFAGLDSSGNPTGLHDLDIDGSTIIGNVSGNTYSGTLFKTTFGELPFLVDPSVVPNLLSTFSAAPSDGTVWLALFNNTPIYDVAVQTPEPSTMASLGLGLLLVCLRFRKAPSLLR
jgi:hypothetical protein